MSNRGVKVYLSTLRRKKRGVCTMLYYNEITDNNGVIYSVDMIRLSITYLTDKTQILCDYLSDYELSGDVIITYYESFKFLSYRHLWRVECKYNDVVPGTCVFSLGMDFNGYKQERDKGFIEFNPNKCMNSKHFKKLLDAITRCSLDMTLKRYDLAIDIPTDRRNVRLVRDRRKYELVENKGALTEYLGARNEGGFVKLYDKTKESDLNYVLTRLEITLDNEKKLADVFPTVYIVDVQRAMLGVNNLNDTEMVLLELLQNSETPEYYLRRCGRKTQNKLKQYLVYDNQFVYNASICRMLRVFVEGFVT